MIELKDIDKALAAFLLENIQKKQGKPSYSDVAKALLPCAGSVLFGLLWGLALCFVGVIMGLVWKDSRPYCSKACLKGSLCGFAFIALFALVDVLFLNNFFNL